MRFLLTLALLLAAACARPAVEAVPPSVLAFTGVTLIDGTGGAPQPNMTVLVVRERIQAIGPTGSASIPSGARVIDARGKYLIPGLWDAHVHLTLAGERALPLLVAHGVTSVRDMGSRLADVRTWRTAIEAGSIVGPRIRTAGPILESARWLQAVQGLPMPVEFPLWEVSPRVGVGTPEEARAVVDSLAGAGVDLIKLRTVASAEVFRAIASQAERHGLSLAGHAPSGIGLAEASHLGLNSIEHTEPTVFALDTFPAAARVEQFEQLARNGTRVVPTIIAEMNWRLTPDSVVFAVIDDLMGDREPRRRQTSDLLVDFWRFQMAMKQFESPMDWQAFHERGMEDLRSMWRAGVPLMAGSDLGAVLVFPGSSLHEELILMAEKIGMSPLEVLQSATRQPAEFFGVQDSIGTIEVGKLADLVLLDANPLEDLRHTQRISAVVLGGRYLDRRALDALLAAAGRAAAPAAMRSHLGRSAPVAGTGLAATYGAVRSLTF